MYPDGTVIQADEMPVADYIGDMADHSIRYLYKEGDVVYGCTSG